jgi:hypothetical protein
MAPKYLSGGTEVNREMPQFIRQPDRDSKPAPYKFELGANSLRKLAQFLMMMIKGNIIWDYVHLSFCLACW